MFPLERDYFSDVPSAAITADPEQHVAEAKEAETVIAVGYTPNAAKSGADTHSRTLNIYNRGQAGAGTVLVAALALVSGVDLVKGVEKVITLSATAANLLLVAGDAVHFESLHIGNGITDAGGKLRIRTRRTAS